MIDLGVIVRVPSSVEMLQLEANVFLFNAQPNVLALVPTFVIVPVTANVAPSPAANPSPVTSTFSFLNAVPSYGLESVALVNTTSRFVIS